MAVMGKDRSYLLELQVVEVLPADTPSNGRAITCEGKCQLSD